MYVQSGDYKETNISRYTLYVASHQNIRGDRILQLECTIRTSALVPVDKSLRL